MAKEPNYWNATGKADRLRLTIANQVYNPATQAFLEQAGLKKNMRVLEVGCGTGEMACLFIKASVF